MQGVIEKIEAKHKKAKVVAVKSGDSVRVHQRVKEGNKTRVQIFEGLVIKTSKPSSLNFSFTVRRIASGVGVEKSYLIHSPNIVKVEVVKRSKVRRNYLSYMRKLTGKSARLSGVEFDKKTVNAQNEIEAGVKPNEPEAKKTDDDKAEKPTVEENIQTTSEEVSKVPVEPLESVEQEPAKQADTEASAEDQKTAKK